MTQHVVFGTSVRPEKARDQHSTKQAVSAGAQLTSSNASSSLTCAVKCEPGLPTARITNKLKSSRSHTIGTDSCIKTRNRDHSKETAKSIYDECQRCLERKTGKGTIYASDLVWEHRVHQRFLKLFLHEDVNELPIADIPLDTQLMDRLSATRAAEMTNRSFTTLIRAELCRAFLPVLCRSSNDLLLSKE